MPIVKRSAGLKSVEQAPPSLVAVVSYALPAELPIEQACGEQYQRLYPKLCAVAERALGPDAAHDVVLDVLLRFWKHWKELTPEERCDSVVMAALKNQVIDVLRRDRRSVELTPGLTDALEEAGAIPTIGPFEPDQEVQLVDVVDQIIAQLPPRCRETYDLVRTDGFTYKEAAEALDISVEGVKDNLKRANTLIREALTDGGYQVGPGASTKALPPSSETSE